jgi:hypothetical protein
MRQRVMVADVRGGNHFLQLTWHPEAGVFVLSHWEGTVCRAATRLSAEDASALVDVLAAGLGEHAEQRDGPPGAAWLPPRPEQRQDPYLPPAVNR